MMDEPMTKAEVARRQLEELVNRTPYWDEKCDRFSVTVKRSESNYDWPLMWTWVVYDDDKRFGSSWDLSYKGSSISEARAYRAARRFIERRLRSEGTSKTI